MFLSGTAFYSARTLLKGRETDLLNLRGFGSSPSCGKTGLALLVFSHGSEAPVIPKGEGQTLRSYL